MQKLQREFSQNDLQFVSINRSGKVQTTDQQLFELKKNSLLQDFHPFFEGIEVYFESGDSHFKLECVHINERIFDVDFIINDPETATVIFREGTDFYNRIQLIAQKRNESIIFNETLELKNDLLKQQEEFKNRFIGNFSHELRNPLTLISSFSSMLLKTDLNLDQNMLVEAVKDQSDKLRDILEDIVDLSVLKTSALVLKTEPLNLRKLVTKIHLNYTTASTQDLDLRLNVDSTLPKNIIGDKRRIEQIITNFLDNAIKFNKGNSITLNLKENQRRANKVSLRIEVLTESGKVPNLIEETTMETYATLDHGDIVKTTGLSFSIARELAQLMDGDISIKQNGDKGTLQVANLKLVFPLHDIILEEEQRESPKKCIELSEKIKTIVAEDNNITQMTALKILVSSGNFDTQVHTDPKNLLEALAKHEYDLILMSSSISQMDALELIKLIKEFAMEENKKIPIIAVTSKTSPAEVSEYRKAGFKDVIKKPYTDDELLNTIYKRLNLKKFK